MREYSKQDLLHQNDDAEIWLATYEDTQVIERIFYQKSDLIEVYRRLLRVHQENLLEILDLWETDIGFTVIEEYIEGVPISELMMGGKIFTARECYIYALGLCAALKVLHENQIVHRDIKPENIMIDEEGVLKLIDFGAARFFNVYQDKDTRFLGTDGYAAPEQYGFSQTDFRTDFYAFGITIKEMLGTQKYSRLEKVLDKCTQLDPDRRYQSAKALEKALKNISFSIYPRILAAVCLLCISALFWQYGAFFHRQKQKDIPAMHNQDNSTVSEPFSSKVSESKSKSKDIDKINDSLLNVEQELSVPEISNSTDIEKTNSSLPNTERNSSSSETFISNDMNQIAPSSSKTEEEHQTFHSDFQEKMKSSSSETGGKEDEQWKASAEKPLDKSFKRVSYPQETSKLIIPKVNIPEPQKGNTIGNTMNGNYIRDYDGWTYIADNFHIWRIKNDETVIEKLFETKEPLVGRAIQVYKGWVYFSHRSSTSSGQSIWRLNIESGEAEDTGLEDGWFYNIKNDWIYYTIAGLEHADFTIVRGKIDGSAKEVIYSDGGTGLIEDNDWLYFNDYKAGRTYRVRSDGSDFKTYEFYSSVWCIANGWHYYKPSSSKTGLERISVEGGEPEFLEIDLEVEALNIQDDQIYLCGIDSSDTYGIYRINTHGNDLEKLFDIEYSASQIFLANGWIYYTPYRNTVYRQRIDGSYPQKMEEIMPTA